MARPPLVLLRAAVLLLGAACGVLLVHAFEEWSLDRALPLSAGHAVFGILLAAAVMPGPILAVFVRPGADERMRGLAFGGCVVTIFAAILGGAFLFRRAVSAGGGATLLLSLGWCLLALPAAAADAWRLRRGEPPTEGRGPGAMD